MEEYAVSVWGIDPTAKGEPGTAVSAPVVVSNENAATEFTPVKAMVQKISYSVVAANPGDGRVEPGKAPVVL